MMHIQQQKARHPGLPTGLNPQLAENSMGESRGAAPGDGGDTGGSLTGPVDLQTLIKSKGYNPSTFNTTPESARYFVIKLYTEDDVHKSIKFEVWSSTDPGNKRLDKAFKDVNRRGPVYLFFSVNASYFCGVAEMLTPVDYAQPSIIGRWKGVFKIRWIFIKDIPNKTLRHIRLTNTQEQKSVTNSRDTQELLPEAGHEMLHIFLGYAPRTTLLQDFLHYKPESQQ